MSDLHEQKHQQKITILENELAQKNLELNIEAALEKVRSRSLAMHESNELQEVVTVVFEKLNALGITLDSVNILIPDDATKGTTHWIAITDKLYSTSVYVPYFDNPLVLDFWRAKKTGADFMTKTYTREEKNNYFEYAFEHTDFRFAPDDRKKQVLAGEGFGASWAITKNAAILMINYSGKLFSESENGILKRFAKVFEQAYVRFMDLQKAEEQARESQIQLALERVRARTIAMQKSDELRVVIQVIYDQLVSLGFEIDNAGFLIDHKQTDDYNIWVADTNGVFPVMLHIPYFDHIFNREYLETRDQELFTKTYPFEQKNTWWAEMWKVITGVPEDISKAALTIRLSAPGLAMSRVSLTNVGLYLFKFSGILYTEAENTTLIRFGKVFEQTYTRFKDLEQAEAQARESQIQLGLERVRAKAMAMQTSEELNVLVGTVFEELTRLDFVLARCLIMIFDPETLASRWWMANSEAPAGPMSFVVPDHDNPANMAYFKAWRERISVWQYELKGTVKSDWDDYLFVDTELARLPQAVIEGMKAPGRVLLTASFNNFGCLTLVSLEPLSDEHSDILLRFAKVFDMCYTRFNDLKQAEAQAREAKIEASLERVRAKTMAMHNSADIGNTAASMFDELVKLGIETSVRCGVLIIDKTKRMEVWAAASDKEGNVSLLIGSLDMSIHPLLLQLYTAWENKEPHFSYELRGDDLKNYYRAITEAPDYPFQYDMQSIPDEQMINLFFFPEGGLFAFTVKPLSEDVANLFKRFTAVFGLTYRRFLDLQKAEAQTREAIKQASVDRVRAEIASMRSTSDLERIIPLIWNELITLGVPFIRCGVFIMDEKDRIIHTYLSTPDGQALVAFQLSFDADGIGKDALAHWRKNQIYTTHWTEEEFAAFSKSLVDRGAVESDEKYRTSHPPTSLDLHFFPFLQGMLYVGNTAPLEEGEMKTVQSLAEAFSTAYARYEDFNKLELAKLQVDKTLTELKATQNQLIQSEKMASLGELTAGIAHEIQNPLNFVNNFSEVSAELIDEMEEELCKGDIKEAKAIAADIRQNLEKIRHHGGRADGIVKGMLLHSRASSSIKELTDINKLTDEYLRLAYHGLRAKDKNFTCKLVTAFDEKLPPVSMVPQDIGRVLVNLFTNAFYATGQKQKALGGGYKPMVSISTLLNGNAAEIRVRDNGNGIAENIKDKIMQPFFTTKPTGEGTGLGLSLSYDIIVKGHGGTLEADSDEKTHTEFIIKLPVN